MGMFDAPPGYPQGQPQGQPQQSNFNTDPRQALAMAMMKGQQPQPISPQAGATGGALQGAGNSMNSPLGMMFMQKMMGQGAPQNPAMFPGLTLPQQ